MIKALVNYFKAVKGELLKVSWPTKEETVRLTLVVIVLSVIFASFIGLLDLLFTYLVKMVVSS